MPDDCHLRQPHQVQLQLHYSVHPVLRCHVPNDSYSSGQADTACFAAVHLHHFRYAAGVTVDTVVDYTHRIAAAVVVGIVDTVAAEADRKAYVVVQSNAQIEVWVVHERRP